MTRKSKCGEIFENFSESHRTFIIATQSLTIKTIRDAYGVLPRNVQLVARMINLNA